VDLSCGPQVVHISFGTLGSVSTCDDSAATCIQVHNQSHETSSLKRIVEFCEGGIIGLELELSSRDLSNIVISDVVFS
jgi:hypothetical protein